MELYIIRHAQTYGNINGDGFSETDLTDLGKNQAFLLGERFKSEPIDSIYTSPLVRAVRTTAAISVLHPGVPVKSLGELLEYGTAPDYPGLTEEELTKIIPSLTFGKRLPTGKEDDSSALLRAKGVIETIRSENSPESTVIIMAHGTFNNYLLTAALGMPLIPGFNFSSENTGVSCISYIIDNCGKPRTKLRYMNDTSHLAPLGEPHYKF